jgi:hypothetical protein
MDIVPYVIGSFDLNVSQTTLLSMLCATLFTPYWNNSNSIFRDNREYENDVEFVDVLDIVEQGLYIRPMTPIISEPMVGITLFTSIRKIFS